MLQTGIPKSIQIHLLDRLSHRSHNCIHGSFLESFHIRLDHLLHFTAYFLICLYYLFGQLKGITLFEKNSLRKFVLLNLLLTTVTEVVHLWVPKRSFNPVDLLANVAGVVIGVGVVIMTTRNSD